MAKKKFVSPAGLNARSMVIKNVGDPVGSQDLASKSFVTNASNLASGTVSAARLPAFTGDLTSSAGGSTFTFPTKAGVIGSYGSSDRVASFTVAATGLLTADSEITIQAGSPTQAGLVTLGNTLSESSSYAATANILKTAYDAAAAVLPASQKGAASGVVPLNSSSKVDLSYIAAPNGVEGKLNAMRVFTPANNGQTYTPGAGTKAVMVIAVGGGGGGGGAYNPSGTSIGGGGAAGATSQSWLTSGFSGVTLTVGSGGDGGVGHTNQLADPGCGRSGGNSSFGSLVVAVGGGGGFGGGQWGTDGVSLPGGAPLPGSGNITSRGRDGHYGLANGYSLGYGGKGASSSFGGAGSASRLLNGSVFNGSNGSAGGGGGGSTACYSATVGTGGRGGDGFIIVYEYT